jgi:hypothetical protein
MGYIKMIESFTSPYLTTLVIRIMIVTSNPVTHVRFEFGASITSAYLGPERGLKAHTMTKVANTKGHLNLLPLLSPLNQILIVITRIVRCSYTEVGIISGLISC